MDENEFMWEKNEWKKSPDEAYLPDETLNHSIGSTAFKFEITSIQENEFSPETDIQIFLASENRNSQIMSFKEYNQRFPSISIRGDVDTAKTLVENTVKHFSQIKDFSLDDISKHLNSQNEELIREDEIKWSDDPKVELAKKAGYVQGVCECVAILGDNHTLAKKLLTEMNVNKDMAKKYANPETYKTLEQGIFAPQQKLEQTQSFKR